MSKRPNILMIVTDQQQPWSVLPEDLNLPVLKTFAKDATNFSRYTQNTVVCGPSRSVLYTGQHVQHTGVTQNPDQAAIFALDPEMPTTGTMLRDQGYYTAYKGKWHLTNINWQGLEDNSDVLEPFGFSDYTREPEPVGYALEGLTKDPRTADEACNWLMNKGRALKDVKPWFLAVNFINPHDIMFFDATGEQSDTRLARIFIDKLNDTPKDPLYEEDLGYGLPDTFYDRSNKPAAHEDYLLTNDYVYGTLPWENEDAWVNFRNYYLNCLRDVDRHIGTLLGALEESGLAENTIVVLTTDHGEMGGAHGQRQKGPFIYRENIGSPMMIRHPDVTGGSSTDALMGATDLLPTLFGMIGLEEKDWRDCYPWLRGHDLSSSLVDPSAPGARDEKAGGVLTAFAMTITDSSFLKSMLENLGDNMRYPDHRGGIRAKRPDGAKRGNFRAFYDGRYRYARYFGPMEHHWAETWEMLTTHNDLELYDTATDPHETRNLGASPEVHKAIILDLNTKMNRLLVEEVGKDRDLGTFFPGPEEMWQL